MSDEKSIRIAYEGSFSRYKNLVARVLYRTCKSLGATPLEVVESPGMSYTLKQFRSFHDLGYNVVPDKVDALTLTSDVTLDDGLDDFSPPDFFQDVDNGTACCDDSSFLRWWISGNTYVFRVHKFFEHERLSLEGSDSFTGLLLDRDSETDEKLYELFAKKVGSSLRNYGVGFAFE